MNEKEDILKLINNVEKELTDKFDEISHDAFLNSVKVLNAFHHQEVSETDFFMTTGYGYNDIGRDKIERIYSEVLGGELSLVRNQFISGTHAISTALFALLRPGDTLLSVTGEPYDTLHEVIGIKNCSSSLKSFNILYKQINLIENDFDYKKIISTLKKNKIKVIEIQRSIGYSTRASISIDKIEALVKQIREVDKNVIILVDNCYCEMVGTISPLEVKADLIVGSLIKNLGAGMCSNGGYISGKKELVMLCAERLNVPGEGIDIGPSLGSNKDILKGLYFAPSVVESSLKTAVLTSKVLETLGYSVAPKYNEQRSDIVQTITFSNENDLVCYVNGIQSGGAIDSNAFLEPSYIKGYNDKIIMASSSFVQGSSIEISCDAPLRKPYIAYQQGSLSYYYGKLALQSALYKLLNKNN